MTTIRQLPFQPRGGALEVFMATEPELLVEGPAGTGKSRAILERLHWFCTEYPRCRVLITRATRASMTESVLVTLEDKVLPPDHPSMASGLSRGGRRSYRYPNGSEIIVAGMETPSRILSTEFDIIYANEAQELTLGQWETLQTRLRNGRIRPAWSDTPFHQAIADCNPDSEFHWLNLRANTKIDNPSDPRHGQPRMRRILSRHSDNPSLSADYVHNLSRLTGVRRQRFYLGIWCTAAGQVWPQFDRAVHMLYRSQTPPLKFFIASMDFGFRAPGVLQVWGVDRELRAYRVAEWYATQQEDDWWADRVVEAHKEFNLKRVVCDGEDPERIVMMNRRLGHPAAGRDQPGICIAANKSVPTGLAVVRDRLAAKQLFLCTDAPRMVDPELVADVKPKSTEEEIPSYCFPVNDEDKPIGEEPDPLCADHGCDAMRYAAMYLWGKSYFDKPKPPPPKGTYRSVLGAHPGDPDWR